MRTSSMQAKRTGPGAAPTTARAPAARRLLSTLVACGALAALAASADAQAVRGDRVLLQGGGSLPVGHANVFAGNDDEFTGPHDLGFTVNFFGTTHTQLFVNNNGNVTFGSGMNTFTPFGLTGDIDRQIIAPFFADIDTRALRPRTFVDALGAVVGRPAGVGRTSFAAYDASSTFGQALGGRDVFSVTWSDVGYYREHTDKTATFQLNLIDRQDTGAGLGNFDIEFNYDAVEWETGDASQGHDGFGGTSARAGYSAGTGEAGTFMELAGSGDHGALVDGGGNALTSHGIGTLTPGRYVFQVRNSGSGTPGESQADPQMPTEVIAPEPGSGQGPIYVFTGVNSRRWFDPPDAMGFEYTGTGGTFFSSVGLPTGFDAFDICWGWATGTPICVDDVVAGSTFDFLTGAGGPLAAFRILGIRPLVDSSNPLGFPTWLAFSEADGTDRQTGDFRMQALLVPTATVPEPTTWGLVGTGLLALGVVQRRMRAGTRRQG